MAQRKSGDTNDRDHGTVVFVLGAGCSADCGAPTMNQFMRTARAYRRESNCLFGEDYDAVRAFRQRCLRISYIFNRWWENIEDLFTQAHLASLIEADRADKLVSQMTRVIWDVYRRPRSGRPKGYDNIVPYLHQLAERWNDPRTEGPRPVLVTTNYDVHLEASLFVPSNDRSGRKFEIVYPGKLHDEQQVSLLGSAEDPDQRFAPVVRRCEHPLELIKLHGSVNWFVNGGDDSPTCYNGLVGQFRLADNKDPTFSVHYEPFVKEVAASNKGTPLIIPPTLGKLAITDVIKTHWQRAVHAFRCAHLIVFAGYSFPETDSFMSRLLAHGIGENDTLEDVVIINSEGGNDWRNRVKSLFSSAWSQNSLYWWRTMFHEVGPWLGPHCHPEPERELDEESVQAMALLRSYLS